MIVVIKKISLLAPIILKKRMLEVACVRDIRKMHAKCLLFVVGALLPSDLFVFGSAQLFLSLCHSTAEQARLFCRIHDGRML